MWKHTISNAPCPYPTKSAPAASRGAGSVNPGWEQGRRDYGWSFTSPVFRVPLEVSGNRHPRQITALLTSNSL
ncbi:MAG: hypothetical protein F6K10_01185 [Moorea sp. SIO2B7]|nr:hypothetical protein [Moorena sp. SIO2B7]